MTESYDGRIDWEAFYRERLGTGAKVRKSGRKLTALCPFHENTNTPAFWVNIDNGMWKCEAGCGGGNPTSFLARAEGIDTKDAHARLLALAGVDAAPKRAKRTDAARPYTVDDYAAEKHLDAALLAEWGCEARRYGAQSWVAMPYKDAEGRVVAVRKRMAPGSTARFLWAKDSKLTLYGLWLVGTWDPATPIVLVEGESDCHALWSLGIPALGVPGASTFRAEWAEVLAGRDVFVHDEGDEGAAVFVARVTERLAEAGFSGVLWRFATPNAKDPSELYAVEGEAAGAMLSEAMRGAVRLDVVASGTETRGGGLLGSLGLLCPRGWRCDERGVWGEDKDGEEYLVTATPVVLARRVVDAGGGGERVEVVVVRDGRERRVVADREQVFTARAIVGLLAPHGAHITSENARAVVRWLGALEAANITELQAARSSSRFGWCGDAFLPLEPRDVLLDADESGEDLAGAFSPKGDGALWLEALGAARDASPVLRFMLAASLAAPLLRAIHGRIMFVYNWGPSRGGKTAAAKAALSAWGDPDRLMTTFNSTAVGLERLAALMCDLPLVVDERQVAGSDQRRIDQTVYMLASGTGRVRGAKDGGLAATSHWRTVVIATGEEPLSGTTSQTGVASRTIELYGAPFSSEAEAAAMHSLTSEHHGHAGRAFLSRVMDGGETRAAAMHKAMLEYLTPYFTDRSSSHLSSIALVVAADALASEWLWGMDADGARIDALAMGAYVIGQIEDVRGIDVDEAACAWVEGWLRANHARFEEQRFGENLGSVEGDVYHVYASRLRSEIEAAGYSAKKTVRALEARGAIAEHSSDGTTSHPKWVHGRTARVISVDAAVLAQGREVRTEAMF